LSRVPHAAQGEASRAVTPRFADCARWCASRCTAFATR